MEYKYRAFISYSHQDDSEEAGKWGEWLHTSLENYKVPRVLIAEEKTKGNHLPDKIFPVFRDRDELPTADDLQDQIEKALADSEFLIVICSPASARSFYVNAEIMYFKRLGREKNILPLIVGGEPNAASKPWLNQEECFPESLKYSLGKDNQLSDQRLEPICADAREGKDGREGARLKILAGILGVGLDLLVRRQEQQRRRQIRNWALAAIFLMSIFAGLSLWALQERNQARLAEFRANQNQELAERERDSSRLLLAKAHFVDQEYRQADELMKQIKEEHRGFEWKMLSSFYHQEKSTFYGHQDRVNVMALSPDGESLLSGDSSGVIKFWKTKDGVVDGEIKIGYVACLAISPSGKLFAASDSVKGKLHLFDIKTRKELKCWTHKNNFVPAVVFLSDGKLVTGTGDGNLHLLASDLSEEIRQIPANSGGVTCLALSPDKTLLAVGGYDNNILLFRLPEFEQVGVLSGHQKQIGDLAFHPKENKIASVSSDYGVRIWDLDSGESLVEIKDHQSFVNAVCWLSNGHILATGSFDRNIHLREGKTARTFHKLSGHAGGILDLIVLSDGQLFSSSHDKTLKKWNIRRQSLMSTFIGNGLTRIALDPDTKKMAVGFATGSLEVYQWNQQFERLVSAKEVGTPLAYTSDARSLLTLQNGVMNWLDSSSFEKESSYKIGRNELDFLLVRPRTREVLINGYFGMVMRIGFEKGSKGVLLSGICPVGAKPMSYSADGRQLVIQSPKENELQVIDADSGKLKLLLASKDASPRLATFNKSGNLLAVVWGEAQLHSGGKDVLQVHDLATGDVVMKAERFDSNFTKVYFADNDQRIILTTFNELRVIDANNGRQMLQLDLSPCWGEVMSTDGKQLLRVGTGVGEMPRASEELFWGRL